MFLQPSRLSCAEISFSVTAPRGMFRQHRWLSGKGRSGHGRLLSKETLPRGLIALKTHMIICAPTVPRVLHDAALLRIITGQVLTLNLELSVQQERALGSEGNSILYQAYPGANPWGSKNPATAVNIHRPARGSTHPGFYSLFSAGAEPASLGSHWSFCSALLTSPDRVFPEGESSLES